MKGLRVSKKQPQAVADQDRASCSYSSSPYESTLVQCLLPCVAVCLTNVTRTTRSSSLPSVHTQHRS